MFRALLPTLPILLLACEPIAATEGYMPPTRPVFEPTPTPGDLVDEATPTPVAVEEEATPTPYEEPEVDEPSDDPFAEVPAAEELTEETPDDHGEEVTDGEQETPATEEASEFDALVQQIVEQDDKPEGEPEPEKTDEPVVLSAAPVGGWGLRLISTLPGTQPPRAVIALPDGKEIVVEPGTFLTEQRMVIVSIERDSVQVTKFTPDGNRAKSATETLVPQYRPAAQADPE